MEEFHCPKCGSFKFGTENCTSPEEEWIGYCHGDYGCDFTWPRKDDHLYFVDVKAAELESIRKRIQFLVDMEPGTVWDEYHWRGALQLQQEFNNLEV
jgi:hypothetical protein